MNLLRVTLALVAVGCAGLLCAADLASPPRPVSQNHFDILYLSEARPIVVRLHMTNDGKPMQDSWNKFADTLFAKLDVDGNGMLNETELTRYRPMIALLSGFIGGPRGGARNDLQSLPRSLSRGEFNEFLMKNDLGPLRLPPMANQQRNLRQGFRRGGQLTGDELDKALLELLDTNKDGKISVAEFTAGIEILARLDTDENELISTEELLRRPQSPYFIAEFDNGMQPVQGPGVELVALSRKGADTNLARRLISRYGPRPVQPNRSAPVSDLGATPTFRQPPMAPEPTVKRLTKKDLKLSDVAFMGLDQDGDDELDTEELGRFGQSAKPEIEIAIRVGKQPGGKAAEVIRGGEAPVKTSVSRGADIAIEIPGIRLDLVAPNAATPEAFRTAFRSRYLNRFRSIDRDGNGYLDKSETENDPLFGELFALLDRNSDGKIFEKELVTALDEVDELTAAAAKGVLTVDLNEAGRGFFGLIDADGDSRISIRELRAMPKLVERFDANKDGSLAASEVPRRFEAPLSPGIGLSRVLTQSINRFGQPMAPPKPQVGPLWFQKMDRNRDGDVSRREFLGTEEQFKKLDTDGDGLISAQEAEAAGKP